MRYNGGYRLLPTLPGPSPLRLFREFQLQQRLLFDLQKDAGATSRSSLLVFRDTQSRTAQTERGTMGSDRFQLFFFILSSFDNNARSFLLSNNKRRWGKKKNRSVLLAFYDFDRSKCYQMPIKQTTISVGYQCGDNVFSAERATEFHANYNVVQFLKALP